jgi:polar amino acid transport system substrate-binding protein
MKRSKFVWMLAAATAFVLASISGSHAESTLDQIIKRGKVLIAIDPGAPPYSSMNAGQQMVGSDVESAQLLAHDLGVKLEVVQTNGQSRIPNLLSGKADLVMATFSITPERAKAVAFSNPYGVIHSVLLAPRAANIHGPADLVGKKIGVTRGTTQEPAIAATAPPGTQIIRLDDDATSLAALASGQIDGLATVDNRALVLNARFPDKHFEVKYDVEPQLYYAIGLRHGDPDLLHWVNTWIFVNLHNGKLGKIYQTWLKAPLPELPAF